MDELEKEHLNINTKLEDLKIIQKEIDEKLLIYEPVSEKITYLILRTSSLYKINPLYKFSIKILIELLKKIISNY